MPQDTVRSAAIEIADSLADSYRGDQGIHAETVIGAAAALAGEFVLRACEPSLPDVGWVVSEKVNGPLFEDRSSGGITLWDIIVEGATRAGADKADLPDPIDVVARTAAAVGGSPFPPLTVARSHYPHEWSPKACLHLRGGIEAIAARYGLTDLDRAYATAAAVAILIQKAQDVVPPETAARLALEVMVGVARMAPIKPTSPA